MSKLKKVILVMILTIVAVITVISFNYKSYAGKLTPYTGELKNYLFSDDFEAGHLWNWDHQPTLMYEDEEYGGISLWCIDYGTEISEYMTADLSIYYAYNENGYSSDVFKAKISWLAVSENPESRLNNIFYMTDNSEDATMLIFFRFSESKGFVPAHITSNIKYGVVEDQQTYEYYYYKIFMVLLNAMKSEYNSVLNSFKELRDASISVSKLYSDPENKEDDYEGDDQDTLDAITDKLPGHSNGTHVTFTHGSVYAIEYVPKDPYEEESIQDKLFLYTAMRSYITSASEVPLEEETVPTEEREEGRYSNVEIQYAMWDLLR